MGARPQRNISPSRRRDRLVEVREHDPYRGSGRFADPSGCPRCGASYRRGRWTWETPTKTEPRALCPACQRIRDNYPAGYVNLVGTFAEEHADEIRNLIRHVEERERREHPLKRVISIRPRAREKGLEVTTTDVRLADSIGRALHRAYQGDLRSSWSEGETLLRVTWQR